MISSTPLDYRLPSTVNSILQGWLISCQSSALISGVLAIVSLLLLIVSEERYSQANNTTTARALNILGYTSLLLNLSACTTCFIILDRLGDVPFRAAQTRGTRPPDAMISLPSTGILREYGIGALWRWIVWHWLICFLFGFWTIVAQILLYVWAQSAWQTKVAVTCVGGFGILPWIAFMLAPVVNGLSRIPVRTTNDPELSPGTPVLTLPVQRPLSTSLAIYPSYPSLYGAAQAATPSTPTQRMSPYAQRAVLPNSPQSPTEPPLGHQATSKRPTRKSNAEKTYHQER